MGADIPSSVRRRGGRADQSSPTDGSRGNRVPVIARLVAADEGTVRDVIHRFNEIGLACLGPRWAGGQPRLLNADDEDFVITTATIRPAKLGQPFTRWSICRLCAYLCRGHGRVIRMGHKALRCPLARRGITFQRTKTWKGVHRPQARHQTGPPDGAPIYVIMDNPSAHRGTKIRTWAKKHPVELCFTPTNAS